MGAQAAPKQPTQQQQQQQQHHVHSSQLLHVKNYLAERQVSVFLSPHRKEPAGLPMRASIFPLGLHSSDQPRPLDNACTFCASLKSLPHYEADYAP